MSTLKYRLKNQSNSQAQASKKIGQSSSRFISRNVIINLPKQKELSVEVDDQQNEKNKLLGSAISYLETAKLIKLGNSADVEESKELKLPASKKISQPINKTNDLDKVISKEQINGKNIESLAVGLSIVLLEKEIKKYLKNSLGISDVPDEVAKHIIFILLPEIIKLENENITNKEAGHILGVKPQTLFDWRSRTSKRKKDSLIALEIHLSNGTVRFRRGDIYKLSESMKGGL